MTSRTRHEMIKQTRSKLIVTARQAFAEHGFAQTSMDDLTAAANLTRGALYHHFGNKEGLLLAVIEQIEQEVIERLQLIASKAINPWDNFRFRCRGYLELSREPEIKQIILKDARAIFGDVPLAAQSIGIAALQLSLESLIREGTVKPFHAEVIARMVYGMVTEASFWIVESDVYYQERLEQAIESLDLLLNGLLL